MSKARDIAADRFARGEINDSTFDAYIRAITNAEQMALTPASTSAQTIAEDRFLAGEINEDQFLSVIAHLMSPASAQGGSPGQVSRSGERPSVHNGNTKGQTNAPSNTTVSYTHLTLPTIYSV